MRQPGWHLGVVGELAMTGGEVRKTISAPLCEIFFT